jgi:hypothetical protein
MAIADRQEKRTLFWRLDNDLGAGLVEVGRAHHREPRAGGALRCAPMPDGSPSRAAEASAGSAKAWAWQGLLLPFILRSPFI